MKTHKYWQWMQQIYGLYVTSPNIFCETKYFLRTRFTSSITFFTSWAQPGHLSYIIVLSSLAVFSPPITPPSLFLVEEKSFTSSHFFFQFIFGQKLLILGQKWSFWSHFRMLYSMLGFLLLIYLKEKCNSFWSKKWLLIAQNWAFWK